MKNTILILILFFTISISHGQNQSIIDSLELKVVSLENQKKELEEKLNEITDQISKTKNDIWVEKNKKLDPKKYYATAKSLDSYFTDTYQYVKIKEGTIFEVLEHDANRGFKLQKLDSPGLILYAREDKLLKNPDGKDYNDIINIQINDNMKKEVAEHLNRTKGKDFFISNIRVNNPDYAGGISFNVEWDFANKNKEIKYLYFTLEPYNAVGDKQTCDIRGYSTFTGKITGPIGGTNRMHSSYFENAWYNNTIKCLKVIKVKIEYMDGSNYVFINEVPSIINTNSQGICN